MSVLSLSALNRTLLERQFLVGRLVIHIRDRADVVLGPGEPYVVEHKPVAEEETHVLLIEPASAPNTGDERTQLLAGSCSDTFPPTSLSSEPLSLQWWHRRSNVEEDDERARACAGGGLG
ncbi:MAG: mannose-6-phosphate isomerase [Thermomicrobiales bacterium]|jgi:hypothetical protein|nr:mannose-6-phosphate isomerase [Thermomicrobiales bacterium]